MDFLKHKYSWFVATGIIIVFIFFCFRPLNSPSYRIIVADGLGYYSYLPAKFIYDDKNLEFKWFDKVFTANYDDHLFAKPTQNFMVKYKDRMINLYYPGQSLLQMPFFFLAHVSAKIFKYPQDGFSFPYQLWMGLSAIVYTLIGLFFCNKLLYTISQNRPLSIYITLLIFFASNLFTYSIFAGCYSHCYSFAAITLSLYFAQRFFMRDEKKLVHLTLLLTCVGITVFIRPVNCILLLSILYFFKPITIKQIVGDRINIQVFVSALILLIVIIYDTQIAYIQTQSLVANTYTIGRFYFNDWSHVWDNFFGFQNGILWYTPVIVICLTALLYVGKTPRLIFLVFPVLLIIVTYSLWFYWNIVNRTLVDFSGILAVLLLYLFMALKDQKKVYRMVLVASFLCIPFFQLKAYQLRNGILNSTYTYGKYYVKHFFTMHHIDVFPVNPSTIIEKKEYFFDYESETGSAMSTENKFDGDKSGLVDATNEYSSSRTFTLPVFFDKPGFKKIKTSFWFYRTPQITNIHLVFSFSRNDSALSYHPFYINTSTPFNKWELKEFGMDLPQNVTSNYKLTVYFWNPEKQNTAFIDNFKLEFILKDGSDEIMLDK